MMSKKMSKILTRISLFFIGLPLMVLIILSNRYTPIPFQLLTSVFVILSTNELYDLIKSPLYPKLLLILCSVSLPLVTYFWGAFYTVNVFLLISILLMAGEAFFSKEFSLSLHKISLSLFVVFYSGYLYTFITQMSRLKAATEVLSVFFCAVFMCDSFAWFFGTLFGKNNKNVLKSSPNKSIAGFIGGYIGSISVILLATFIFREIFTGDKVKAVLLGFLVSSSAIIGDLIESVIKRSVNVKDSGKTIPGRGGALDSVDSLLLSAPVYLYFLKFLYGVN